MPYLGRDWRSPGDQWVRTKEGWEKLKLWRVKVFENLNENILARLIRLAVLEWGCKESDYGKHQPHIHYVRGISRERKVLTSLSEAFIHLDVSGAVKDIRRFNYVSKLVEKLLKRKLVDMSGTSQKYLFSILEEMVNQVLKTKINVGRTKELLICATNSLSEGHIHHIGSSSLWNKHIQSVNKMVARINRYQVQERKEDGKVMLLDLPKDCIRCIFSRLADHKDVIHTGMTNTAVHEVSEEGLMWKRLCFFHFTNNQLMIFLPEQIEGEEDNIDWKYIYKRCVLRFGKKDVYADTLAICCHCDTLFWQSIGHPCISEEEPMCKPLTPDAFIKLFVI